jgi:hypothetical protein
MSDPDYASLPVGEEHGQAIGRHDCAQPRRASRVTAASAIGARALAFAA